MDDLTPNQNLSPTQFSDFIGPTGSFGLPNPAPSMGTPGMGGVSGVSDWTAPLG